MKGAVPPLNGERRSRPRTAAPTLPGAQLHTQRRHRPRPTILYHYTCSHHAPGIVAVGALVPAPHPYLPWAAPLVWLTDDPQADRDDLGLTSDFLACDRTEHLFETVEVERCLRWLDVCETAPSEAYATIAMLNHGRAPESWWVAVTPVAVLR